MRSIAASTPWRMPRSGFGCGSGNSTLQRRRETARGWKWQSSMLCCIVRRFLRTEGTANVFKAKYPRVKEEDHAEEQELPQEVSSVQFNSSTPTAMGMEVEERQAPEAGPFCIKERQTGGPTGRAW